MPPNLKKPSLEHDDLSFFRTLYHASVRNHGDGFTSNPKPDDKNRSPEPLARGDSQTGPHPKYERTINMTLPNQQSYAFLCIDDDEPAYEILCCKHVKKLLGLDKKTMHTFMTNKGVVQVCFTDIEDFLEGLQEKGLLP